MGKRADEVAVIIETAHTAYLGSKAAPSETRAAWLEEIASALEANASELVHLAVNETNLQEGRLRGEIKRTVFQLRLLTEEVLQGEHLDATIDHADVEWGMGPRPDLRRLNVPLGVVGVFGASNFPFAFSVIGGDSASALAAGCSVVHKIHDGHRALGLRTSEIVTEALLAAGAPVGLFATVMGREAAETLVDHPLVKAIGFTGSTSGGRALFDRTARRPEPIPFYGELGSINPVFVTERAWAARHRQILTEYAGSMAMGMGQFCTKPGLMFAPIDDVAEVRDVLMDALVEAPLTPLLSPRLREGFDESLLMMKAIDGVTVLVRGDSAEAPFPTVLFTTTDTVLRAPELLETEMFGPATLVIAYETGADLAELAGLMQGQLTSTLQAEPDENLATLTAALSERSGRVLWNGWPTGVTVSYAQQHGGPYPAATAVTTSVGTAAIRRFMRSVAFQSFPSSQLPAPLQDDNPWAIRRRIDGDWTVADHGREASTW